MARLSPFPRWARIALVILAALFVLFLAWLFLGAADEEASAATRTPAGVGVVAPMAAVDEDATTDSEAAGVTTTALVSSCPSYIFVIDPGTGGTTIVDQCADGDVATVSAANAVTAVASKAGYGSCRQASRKITVKNKLGWSMFWARLTKYWCWRNGVITYHPATQWTHGVTSFGSTMQWDDWSLVDKATWNTSWESYSWAIQKFKRCLPAPWGCIKVGDRNIQVNIHGYANGTASY